jgi:putative FmdB family regulatory protein
MPIYVYACSSCGSELTIRQKISDTAPKECPSCRAEQTLAKKLAPSSFKLEGGGWFAHGYMGGGSGASGNGQGG